MKPAIVIFTSAASATAQRVAALTAGELVDLSDGSEASSLALARLFAQKRPIIGVCAAGILIRLLAPHLADKHDEPPVLAVSVDGAHVVPLLGGHHGANRLAREIADGLAGVAALTTASDVRFARGLDEPPQGYVLANPQVAKAAMVDALRGESVDLKGHAPWVAAAGYALAGNGRIKASVTEKRSDDGLVYHPKTLVAGMGCERGAEPDEVLALLQSTLASAGLAPESLAAIATIDLKADEAALHAVAAHFGVPLRLFSAEELAEETPRLENPSAVVLAEVGTPGVSEAAALKAGTLLVAKQKSKRATCAIGRAETPIDERQFGRARGGVHIVGIGPGEAAQRTASMVSALEESSDWVGYDLYLDLIADLNFGQKAHRFGLGDEEPRVRHALELAAQGKTVSLVCSGDAQIYAMASLAYELLNAEGPRAVSVAASRVAVESHPGISAFQMASARAGALIGHDFCCISLSDLLTPREDILKRLKAAAEGDFVTAFYNPRSKRRTDLIVEAKSLFEGHRPPATPVIIASNLGRPEEQVRVVELADFNPEEIDMLTIVLIGSSQSRAFKRGDGKVSAFTPRGYAKKAEKLS